MRVAVIQLNAKNDKTKNLEKAVNSVEKAIRNKAKFILLPEVFNYRGKPCEKTGFLKVAESIPGPSIKPFLEIAKKNKVSILAGSIYERTKGSKKAYNSSVLIDDKGKIVSVYRKNNLFDANIDGKKIRESKYFFNGKKTQAANVDKFKIGLAICYDLRFSDIFLKYKKQGVDLLCIPSAFTKKTGQLHWETLLRSRAIENRCYVLAPNQVGKNSQGVECYGNSMIIDPNGKILSRASLRKEEIIYSYLSFATIKINKKMFNLGQGKL